MTLENALGITGLKSVGIISRLKLSQFIAMLRRLQPLLLDRIPINMCLPCWVSIERDGHWWTMGGSYSFRDTPQCNNVLNAEQINYGPSQYL